MADIQSDNSRLEESLKKAIDSLNDLNEINKETKKQLDDTLPKQIIEALNIDGDEKETFKRKITDSYNQEQDKREGVASELISKFEANIEKIQRSKSTTTAKAEESRAAAKQKGESKQRIESELNRLQNIEVPEENRNETNLQEFYNSAGVADDNILTFEKISEDGKLTGPGAFALIVLRKDKEPWWIVKNGDGFLNIDDNIQIINKMHDVYSSTPDNIVGNIDDLIRILEEKVKAEIEDPFPPKLNETNNAEKLPEKASTAARIIQLKKLRNEIAELLDEGGEALTQKINLFYDTLFVSFPLNKYPKDGATDMSFPTNEIRELLGLSVDTGGEMKGEHSGGARTRKRYRRRRRSGKSRRRRGRSGRSGKSRRRRRHSRHRNKSRRRRH